MTLVRWMFGLPLAAAVVMFLVLLMSGLIRQEFVPTTPSSIRDLIITPQIKEEPIRKTETKRPTITETPPEPDVRRTDPIKSVGPVTTVLPDLDGAGEIDIRPPAGGGAVIQVAPPYPEACASKGIEGVVLVEFDVTAEGSVVNARVISSPHQCFNRATVKAVSGWKYPPDMRDGRPAPRYGLVERFNYQLTD